MTPEHQHYRVPTLFVFGSAAGNAGLHVVAGLTLVPQLAIVDELIGRWWRRGKHDFPWWGG